MIIEQYTKGLPVPKMARWAYAAEVFEPYLNAHINKGRVKRVSIPPGVMYSVKQFFADLHKALKAKDVAILHSKEYAVTRYVLATLDAGLTEETLKQKIEAMALFMKNFESNQTIHEGDRETVKLIRDLLKEIASIGGQEGYNEMMLRSHEHLD